MDIFVQATIRGVGHGGIHCPCCSCYRTTKGKRSHMLSKIRRARLKAALEKIKRKGYEE